MARITDKIEALQDIIYENGSCENIPCDDCPVKDHCLTQPATMDIERVRKYRLIEATARLKTILVENILLKDEHE